MQSKRFVLLLLIVVVIIGGILFLAPQRNADNNQQEESNNQTSEQQEEQPQTDEQTREGIIEEVLGTQFNTQTATHATASLDNQEGPELIIGAVENVEDPWGKRIAATIQVVSLTGETDEYERVGGVQYRELMRGVPEAKEFSDITGNGQAEVVMNLMFGGASSWAEGILQINVAENQVQWLQLRDQQDEQRDAIFVLAASAAHHNTYEIVDLDQDGSKEIVETAAQIIGEDTECSADVYAWNGELFAYSAERSEETLAQLSENCEL